MPGSTFTDRGPDCPVRDAERVPLGTLGRLDHWTCRDCGHQYSTPADDDDPDLPDPWDGADEW